MKPRHHIAAAVLVAVCIAAALDAQQSASAARAHQGAEPGSMPRKYWLVTPVTLDRSGTVETAGRPEILDSQAAYRLADVLATQEARERAGVSQGALGAEPGQRRRCAAEAASTGEQCRNYAVQGSAHCRLHDPNYRD